MSKDDPSTTTLANNMIEIVCRRNMTFSLSFMTFFLSFVLSFVQNGIAAHLQEEGHK
jgi:F0F1-type ATP synthase membrane subunit a